jgi:hypothetical protein
MNLVGFWITKNIKIHVKQNIKLVCKITVATWRDQFRELPKFNVELNKTGLYFRSCAMSEVILWPITTQKQFVFRDSSVTHNTTIQSVRWQISSIPSPSSELIASRTINKIFWLQKGMRTHPLAKYSQNINKTTIDIKTQN